MTKKNRKSSARKEVHKKKSQDRKGKMGNKATATDDSAEGGRVAKAPKRGHKNEAAEEKKVEEEVEVESEDEDEEEDEMGSASDNEEQPEQKQQKNQMDVEVEGNDQSADTAVVKRPTFCIKQADFVQLTPELASRILHPNPCCFLTTIPTASTDNSSKVPLLNAMTLSWLAPANNYGGFVFVIHKTRFSADCIVNGSGKFTLSVAHAGLRDVLLACGKVSGKAIDKFNNDRVVGLRAVNSAQLCASNDRAKQFKAGNSFSALDNDSDSDSEDEDTSKTKKSTQNFELNDGRTGMIAPPVQGTVAHLACRVVQHSDAADAGHWLITGQIEDAFVHPSFWDGKCFEPKLPNLPPLVSFLGSQRFGFIVAEE